MQVKKIHKQCADAVRKKQLQRETEKWQVCVSAWQNTKISDATIELSATDAAEILRVEKRVWHIANEISSQSWNLRKKITKLNAQSTELVQLSKVKDKFTLPLVIPTQS